MPGAPPTEEGAHLTFTLKTFPADVCSWSVEGKVGCREAAGGQAGCPGGSLGASLGWRCGPEEVRFQGSWRVPLLGAPWSERRGRQRGR